MMKDPGRLAWTVLIISLIIFCLTSSAIFLAVRWFLLESTVPMTATLYVGRGTVGVRASAGDAIEQAERGMQVLSRDVRLSTDGTSQGYVAFIDPHTYNLVATLVLHRDSSITLESASQPRFDFSHGDYVISFRGAQGQIDIDITPDLPRDIVFDVATPLGRLLMDRSGRYLLTSQGDELSVWNRMGRAFVINRTSEARAIPEGMQARVTAASDEIVVFQTLVDILPDGSFDTFNPANEALSSAWRCYNKVDDAGSPEGIYRREIVNDMPVMHILRTGEGTNNHAETGCLQYLNTSNEPLPITAYNYLELRAGMVIRSQSLSTCGIKGSECPVMLVMNYVDQNNVERRWIHGFYARYDPAAGYPLRCDTCALEHERLNPDAWYTFSSGNLLQLLPDDQRPTGISNVHFYASGHQYEVMLSEVALLAGNVPPPTTESALEATPEASPAATPAASPEAPQAIEDHEG